MTQILCFSMVIWILIDRFKGLWSECEHRSIITSAVALLLGGAVAICYKLDLVVGLGLADETTPLGVLLTALALMGGSSCIAEIIERVQNPLGKVDILGPAEIADILGINENDDNINTYDDEGAGQD